MSTNNQENLQGVAIIGMSGRFPGAADAETFWKNICDGVESIEFFPELRQPGMLPNIVMAGALLKDPEHFDADFFGFTETEALITDPQQRLMLECAWEALEGAGYDSHQFDGPIGLYTAAATSTYSQLLFANPSVVGDAELFLQAAMNNDNNFIATRLAYLLNLQGPTFTVSSACSSSAVAIHLACQSLLTYETDMALATGVSCATPQKQGYFAFEGGPYSYDGKNCNPFDANTKGAFTGHACGALLLKRVEDAVADGDPILAVIRASAANNDGASKVGFNAISPEGLERVFTDALSVADVDPETIGFIATHGMGTALGDAIEASAMAQAYGADTDEKAFIAIGSVKPNIGHTGPVAGMVNTIETVMALKTKTIPPLLNFGEPNPQIDFDNAPFYVSTVARPWESDGPRCAGVTSAAVGGTNVHLIMEEAPELAPSSESRTHQLIMLSAKTPTALEKMTENLVTYLEQNADAKLADVAHTLQTGRAIFNNRRVLVASSREEAIRELGNINSSRVLDQVEESTGRTILFAFGGQTDVDVNIGRELYDTEAAFREQVDLCADALNGLLNADVRGLLYPEAGAESQAKQVLENDKLARAARFIYEYALAKLWLAWGVQPVALVYTGRGEYVAACVAETIELEDALRLAIAGDDEVIAMREAIDEKEATIEHSSVEGGAQPGDVILEIGTGVVGLTKEHLVLSTVSAPSSLSAEEGRSELEVQLVLLGQLWLQGISVDWKAFYAEETRHRLALPTYPFERKKYLLEPTDTLVAQA